MALTKKNYVNGKTVITAENLNDIQDAVIDLESKGGVGMGITGATPGQIAKITAVDAQGKPTAWEPVNMPSGGVTQMVKIGELPFTTIADETILLSDVDTTLKVGGDNMVTSLEEMNVLTGNAAIDTNLTAEYPDAYSVTLTSTGDGVGHNHYKLFAIATEIGKTYTVSANCEAEQDARISLFGSTTGVRIPKGAPGRYSFSFEATAETSEIALYLWGDKTAGNYVTYSNMMICEGDNTEFSTGSQSFELTAGVYETITIAAGTLLPAVDGAIIGVYEKQTTSGGMTEEQVAQLAQNTSKIAENTAAIAEQNTKIEELEAAVSGLGADPNAGVVSVFFGDSIPAFDANTGGTGAIPDYMQKKCGGVWHNFCVGGTTMSAYRTSGNGYEYFTLDEWADSIAAGDFANQEQGVTDGATAGSTSYSIGNKVADAKALDWSAVKRIFLAYGTNDLAYDVSEVGAAGDTAAKNGTMCAALKYAVQTILTAYPTIEIVVCGIIYRYADSVSASEIIGANEAIRASCEAMGVPFAPLFDNMGVNVWNRNSFLYDGTHPNANGKERYADTLKKLLCL